MQKTKKAVILLALLSISAFAQSTFTDSRDGKKYKSVKIGKQTWMAQNLDYHGEDGNLGVCYDNKPENCTKYGGLYDWNEAKKACPKGWHLPSDKEWQTLVDFAGGTKAGRKLRVKAENGSDDYGFSALLGGTGYSGNFEGVGYDGIWWSASEREDSSDVAYGWSMDYGHEFLVGNDSLKSGLSSVRCLQD